MKRISVYLFFIFVSFFLFSCAKKPFDFNSFDNNAVLREVKLNNPFICQYKSRVLIFFEDRFYKLRVRALLKKRCNNDFFVYFLGPFNQIVASVSYVHGNVRILDKEKDVSEDYEGFFTEDRIKRLVMLFNVPLFYPQDVVERKVVEGKLVIRDSLGRLFKIDKDFHIVFIKTDGFSVEYSYEKEGIKKIDYVDFSQKLSITFL